MKHTRNAPKGLTRHVVPVEFRAADGQEGKFTAVVLRYNVLDDYDTMFSPGVFDDSLAQRMPRIVWGHDWRQVLGRWTSARSDGNQLILEGQFDDFDAVPMARQAWHQLKSGTIDQFSVGFVPTEWRDEKLAGQDRMVRVFTRGRLDEVSLVLVGAVPGTELLSVRQMNTDRLLKLEGRAPLISKDKAAAVLLRLNLGEIDLADALAAIKDMEPEGQESAPPAAPAAQTGDPATGDPDPQIDEEAAAAEAAQAAAAQAAAEAEAAANAEIEALLAEAGDVLARLD